MKRKLTFSAAAAALMLFACSCGYRIGYLTHPQLSSVAVAPVTNETLSYNAAVTLQQKLAEVFTTDGSLKLKSVSKADCIVYARILSITYSESSGHIDDDDDFLPSEWKVTVTVEYSVILPGRAKPLIGPRRTVEYAKFISNADLENARHNAVRQALFSTARTIVSNLTEAW